MAEQPGMFICQRCNRDFEWQPELVGRRAKCKCGASFIVPESPGRVAVTISEPEAPTATPAPTPAPTSAPLEDDGIPALGPEPTPDGVPLYSPLDESASFVKPKRGVKPGSTSKSISNPTASQAARAKSASAGQQRRSTPSKKQATTQDESWDPFVDRGRRSTTPLDDDMIELDLSSMVQPKPQRMVPVVPEAAIALAKERARKQGGIGQPFLYVPPRLGFIFAAIGISLVLGGMIFFFTPIILAAARIAPRSILSAYTRHGQLVAGLMALGPFLCIAAPTDWKARAWGLTTMVFVSFIWMGLPMAFLRGRFAWTPPAIAIFGLPLVFFTYIGQIGRCFGAYSLTIAAFVMCVTIYFIGGLIFWFSTIERIPQNQWLFFVIGYLAIALMVVIVVLAIRTIAAIVLAITAMRPR